MNKALEWLDMPKNSRLIFLPRRSNKEFFFALSKEHEKINPKTKVVFGCMERSTHKDAILQGIASYNLPRYIERAEVNRDYIENVDAFSFDLIGVGIYGLVGTERFRPGRNEIFFWQKHISALGRILHGGVVLCGLNLDHTVFNLAALINAYEGGENIFVLPVGFPLNANIVKENLWRDKIIRDRPLDTSHIREYAKSLDFPPEKTLNYMKDLSQGSFGRQKKQSFRDFLKASKTSLIRNAKKRALNLINCVEARNINARYLDHQKMAVPENCLYSGHAQLEPTIKNNPPSLPSGRQRTVLFPLQVEPEITTVGYARLLRSQPEALRLISESLSYNDTILLKEHPKLPKRPRWFIREISRLLNVEIISNTLSVRSIISDVDIVATLSGTAAIEAAVLGKPSITFGEPPFSKLLIHSPIVEGSLSDLRAAIYKDIPAAEIKEQLYNSWPQYSKSIILGDYIGYKIEEGQRRLEFDAHEHRELLDLLSIHTA